MVRCVCITIQYNAGRRYIKYVRSWCAAPGPHLAAGIDGDRQRVLGAPRHFRRHLRELRVARMRRLDVVHQHRLAGEGSACRQQCDDGEKLTHRRKPDQALGVDNIHPGPKG